MSKFKVGDKIIGNKSANRYLITREGWTGKVYDTRQGALGVQRDGCTGKALMWVDPNCFELVNAPNSYELHITCNDGKTTNAVYKVNGEIKERAQAKCSPSDTFDFEDGARTAFCRVFPPLYEPFAPLRTAQPAQPEKVESKYKSGDKVKIIANFERHHFPTGTIVRLAEDGHIPKWKAVALDGVAYSGSPYWFVSEEDIEPYTEPTTPEPTLYVTREMLEKLGACSSGRAEFDSKFPSGKGEFEAVCKATMPANESWLVNHKSQIAAMQDEKDEPIRLYCVKDFTNCFGNHALTKGKIYEFDGHKVNYDEFACAEFKSFESWKALDPSYAERLIPLVRRAAKVGEWVIATDNLGHRAETNKPYKVVEIGSVTDWVYVGAKNTGMLFRESQYLVLDGYVPEEKVEEYYNGEVICTEPDGFFTQGKKYKFVKGLVRSDTGNVYNSGDPITSLDETGTNSWVPKFIPYLGEAK